MFRGLSDRPSWRHCRGFTLLETLITTALFSIVIIGVYLLYTTMQNTLSRGELKSDLQQNARVGLDRMVQELRMAGYNPSGASPGEPPLQTASQTSASFVTANPNTGAAIQVTYSFDATTLTLRRDDGGGGQPLAESVNCLTLIYFDVYNQVLTPPSVTTAPCPSSGGLTLYQRRQVRRVAIALKTVGSRADVPPEFFTLTSDVRLRNR